MAIKTFLNVSIVSFFIFEITLTLCSEQIFTLSEAINYTLKNNPDLQNLELTLDNQKAETIIQEAVFAYNLATSSSYSKDAQVTSNSITLSKELPAGLNISSSLSNTRDNIGNTDTANFSVTLSKKILGGDTWLETRNAIDDSLINETIKLNNIRRKKRQLIYQIKINYYSIIRSIESLSIQKRRLERAKKNLEHAIEREEPLDIVTAKIQIPENKLAVIAAQRAIKVAIDALKVLMGMPVGKEIKIDKKFDYFIKEVDFEKDLEFCFKNHEDFLNNKLTLKKLKWEEYIKNTHLSPDLTLSMTHTNDNFADNVNLNGTDENKVVLSMSWELGLNTDKANYRKALNNIKSNKLDYFQLQQKTAKSIRDLIKLMNEKIESVSLQNQKIKLAQYQLELYKDRWENGEINILELVRTHNDLEDSKVKLITLKTRYMELLAEYIYRIGK